MTKEVKQEQDEPYGYFRYDIRLDAWVQSRDNNKGVALYTKPQQRKPLTEKQIDEIYYNSDLNIDDQYNQMYAFVKAIEAKLKEKNT
jgi:hypothetical protein